jgi:hypothetical protein
MQAIIHAADIQDRDGGMLLMGALFGLYPLKPYADRANQGAKFQAGLHAACGHINLEIVKRADRHEFVALSKRWIVERTIAWLNRTGLAFLRRAIVRLMMRRLCQKTT